DERCNERCREARYADRRHEVSHGDQRQRIDQPYQQKPHTFPPAITGTKPYVVFGSSATCTSCLPRFLLVSRRRKALGVFSMPRTTSNLDLISPARIQFAMRLRASAWCCW